MKQTELSVWQHGLKKHSVYIASYLEIMQGKQMLYNGDLKPLLRVGVRADSVLMLDRSTPSVL